MHKKFFLNKKADLPLLDKEFREIRMSWSFREKWRNSFPRGIAKGSGCSLDKAQEVKTNEPKSVTWSNLLNNVGCLKMFQGNFFLQNAWLVGKDLNVVHFKRNLTTLSNREKCSPWKVTCFYKVLFILEFMQYIITYH